MKFNHFLCAFFSIALQANTNPTICQEKVPPHIIIKKNNSECLIDLNQKELIPPGKYARIKEAVHPDKRLFEITAINGKEGLYLIGRGEVLPCEYDDIGWFNDYDGSVMKNNKWALMNRNFEITTDFIFDEQVYFLHGKASVKKNGKFYIIDNRGKELKELPYDDLIGLGFQGKYKRAKMNNKYGYIDSEGNVVIPLEYEDVEQTVETNLFPVQKDGKWGYVNEKNQVVVPFKYRITRPVMDGVGIMQDKNFVIVGAINEKGVIIYDDYKYQDISYANAGKYKVMKNGLWGYIDSVTYQEIIPLKFSSCGSFYNNIAIVKFEGFANIIDTKGNLLLPQNYQGIYNWGKILFVEKDKKYGAINKEGNILLPIEYDMISYGGPFANIKKNNLWGKLKYDLSILIEPKYESISEIDEDHFLVRKDKHTFILDKSGKETLVE